MPKHLAAAKSEVPYGDTVGEPVGVASDIKAARVPHYNNTLCCVPEIITACVAAFMCHRSRAPAV